MHATTTHSSIPLQFNINARVYHRAGIEYSYLDRTLMRADGVALLKYQPAFAHRDILDIGAGTGRTAVFLGPLAHRYQAVDYSPVMVTRFRHDLPGWPIVLADMRDLSRFTDGDFDFVLASNNVFDAVDHADRLRTLHEMHRVLRPGGTLMFSSHNRDVDDIAHWPRLERSRNPVTQLQFAVHWFHALVNHARLQHMQTFADDHAIVNDDAHDSGLLHYYIGPEAQKRQLTEQGFELLEVFDKQGAQVAPGDHAPHSRWLLYVARRLPVS